MQVAGVGSGIKLTSTYGLTKQSAFAARFNTMFEDGSKNILHKDEMEAAKIYAEEFRAIDHNIGGNSEYLNVWRTSPMVALKDVGTIDTSRIKTLNIDDVFIPEPIANVFTGVFGDQLTSVADLLLAPTQKISINPPQLHTMPDLPAEEWYNFDWIGMIDAMIEHKNPIILGKTGTKNKIQQLEIIKERLAEILPEKPSPKNSTEAFFWQEIKNSGMTPYEHHKLLLGWENIKRHRAVHEALGLSTDEHLTEEQSAILEKNGDAMREATLYGSAIHDLVRGDHWKQQDIDPNYVADSYYNALQTIKQDPNYEKTFDSSISYDERESIRMELDKKMHQMIIAAWERTLYEFQQSLFFDDPLQSVLSALKGITRKA